jgi:hypothetical protein
MDAAPGWAGVSLRVSALVRRRCQGWPMPAWMVRYASWLSVLPISPARASICSAAMWQRAAWCGSAVSSGIWRLGAFDADPWAITEAVPSDEEIGRVRRLIDRVRADLDDLTEQERADIQHAVAMVRRSRVTMLGMPRAHSSTPRLAAAGGS